MTVSFRLSLRCFLALAALTATPSLAGTKAFVGFYRGLERYDIDTGERQVVLDLPFSSDSASNSELNVASVAHDPATGVVYAIVAPTIYELNVPTTGERIVRIPTNGGLPELLLSLEGTDRPEALFFDPLGALRFRMRKAGGVVEQRSLNLSTGVVTTLADTRTPTQMTATKIYFTVGDALIAENRSTGTSQTIATVPGLGDAAIDEDNNVAFVTTSRLVSGFSTYERTVTRVSLTGAPAPTVLLSTQANSDGFSQIATDPLTQRVLFMRHVGVSPRLESLPYAGGASTPFTHYHLSFPQNVAFAVGGPSTSMVSTIAAPPTQTDIAWHYAMGARFVAERNGKVTQLGGRFTGTKIVRLFRDADHALLAEANVVGAGGSAFAYAPIAPVPLVAGQTYVVAVYLAGSGGSYGSLAAGVPVAANGLRFLSSVYAYTASSPNEYPTTTATNIHYGTADLKFSVEGFVAPAGPAPAEVWASNASAALGPTAWHYAMGYAFTPQVSGRVTALGGRFSGTKRVRLYDDATQAVLAEAMVTSTGSFAYAPASVAVVAGHTYVVAVSLAGSGGYYETTSLPRAHGSIVIENSRYGYTGSNPEAYPSTSVPTTMYGQADIRFSGDEPTTADQPQWRSSTALAFRANNLAYSGGLRFVPTQDAWLTALGGRFRGSVPVELHDLDAGTMLASTTVTGTSSYSYRDIVPVRLTAGRHYLVVARVEQAESVSEILFDGVRRLPRTVGLVTVEAALTGPLTGMPTTSQPNDAYGVPDFLLAQ